MSWDPREGECLGYFGYGTGYFAEGQHTNGASVERGFCVQCPLNETCWGALRGRVDDEQPAVVALFDSALGSLDRYFREQLPEEQLPEGYEELGVEYVRQALAGVGVVDPYVTESLRCLVRGATDHHDERAP